MTGQLYNFGVLLMVITTCGGIASASPSQTQTLRVSHPKVGIVLDPHKMEDAFSMAVVLQLYRGLMRYTPQGESRPDLAESWTESTDHLRYVFKLKDANFSNGKPITAKNVQMSIARIFFLGASMGADLDYITGVDGFRKSGDIGMLGVKPLSDSEIEFRLNKPSALFLKHLAVVDCAVLPIENYKEELAISPASAFSGPYKLKKPLGDTGLELEKWRADPFDSANPPANIQILLSDEQPEALARQGKTDSLDHERVAADSFTEFTKAGWKSTATEIIAESFVILNPKKIAPELRQFLFARVDSKELVRRIGANEFRPAFGLIPTGIAGELREKECAELLRDPRAKVELSKPAHLEVEYDIGNAIHEKIVGYLSEVWKTPNLDIQFKGLSRKEKLARMFGKESQACIGLKLLDYPDGFSVLTYFKSGYPGNYFHVENAAIDSSINNLVNVFDESKRLSLYRDIQNSVLKQHTVVPLFFGTQASGLWGPKVKSVPSHPMGFHTLPYEMVEMKSL